jgi:hypothetical protein
MAPLKTPLFSPLKGRFSEPVETHGFCVTLSKAKGLKTLKKRDSSRKAEELT